MKFADSQLQEHYDRLLRLLTNLPEELRPVCALMDAYGRFRVTDGEEAERVRETVAHLLSPELRPALRSWYQMQGDSMNPAAIEFRERLAKLAGERFG